MTTTPDTPTPARPGRPRDAKRRASRSAHVPAGNIPSGQRITVVLQEWEHFGDTLGWTTERFARHFDYTPEGLLGAFRKLGKPHDLRVASFEAAWAREHSRT